ncbi:MAG: M28 family peptidase [Actinobacteria bacterium]|nr:M28 family peptidase [Actinomycetota bacterium]
MTRLAAFATALCAAVALVPGTADAVVSGTRAKALVERIASAGPRPAGSANERRAAGIVAARFRELGLQVTIQTFPLPGGGTSRNVVARTDGPTRAVIVAHMDGVREGPAANDNGSGVATMLEVAGMLRGRPGILFAALGAEERAETGSHLHLGSVRLLQALPRSVRPRIVFALSLDMVGVGTTLNVRGIEPRPNRSARRVLTRGRALGLRPAYLQDAGVSDHAEMSRGNLPAALVTWRWDSCWHERCDRAVRVSARKMGDVGRLTVASLRAALG